MSALKFDQAEVKRLDLDATKLIFRHHRLSDAHCIAVAVAANDLGNDVMLARSRLWLSDVFRFMFRLRPDGRLKANPVRSTYR